MNDGISRLARKLAVESAQLEEALGIRDSAASPPDDDLPPINWADVSESITGYLNTREERLRKNADSVGSFINIANVNRAELEVLDLGKSIWDRYRFLLEEIKRLDLLIAGMDAPVAVPPDGESVPF